MPDPTERRGWTDTALGEGAGQGRLGCRPATLLQWVHDSLHVAGEQAGYCAVGQSGGATQLSYSLAHYGRSEILDLVLLTGGPSMNRIDLGCLRDDPAQSGFWYTPAQARNRLDQGFGFPNDGTGPCSLADQSWTEAFREASLTIGDWEYSYPSTLVWFLLGENDTSAAVAHGLNFYERLLQERSPYVQLDTIPNTGHGVPATPEGAERVTEIVLQQCLAR